MKLSDEVANLIVEVNKLKKNERQKKISDALWVIVFLYLVLLFPFFFLAARQYNREIP